MVHVGQCDRYKAQETCNMLEFWERYRGQSAQMGSWCIFQKLMQLTSFECARALEIQIEAILEKI